MKNVPFSQDQISELRNKHPTPFYIYYEAGIRTQTRTLIRAFSWNSGFREYYAVKALPNPAILQILKEEGCGMDCSSLPELLLAERVGITGEAVMFTSNDTPAEEFVAAKKMGAIINLDDINHLEYLERHAGLPDLISFRYNPGLFQYGNDIIGNPREAKFGMTKDQLIEGYKRAKAKGIQRFGLHTMLVSNELEVGHLIKSMTELFACARDIESKVDMSFEFINLGGGIGIPYRPEQVEFDVTAFSAGVEEAYATAFGGRTHPIKLYMECGRYITGPFGYLVSTVRHVKDTYKAYVGMDACMADLMRPGMYGAYHHITVLGKEALPSESMYDVVGSLCENNDKFAVDRQLPKIESGDVIVIHDTGAHGHAMGFNYNGKLRSAEFLMNPDGSFRMIRRAETLEDHFSTLI